MPYDSVEEAKAAKFPTTADKVSLTLAQINHLARIYDVIKKAGSADNPMAVAWTQWKEIYEKKDGKWVLKEGKTAVSNAFVLDSHDHRPAILNAQISIAAEDKSIWIPIAKVGQTMQMPDGKVVYPTEEGFEMAVTLFNTLGLAGYVNKNHSKVLEGLTMLEQKFKAPFLYGKFNSEGEAKIKDPKSNGRSIETTIFSLNEINEITHFLVPGVSVLYGSHTPACTPQMGCASVVQKSDNNPNIDFDIVVSNNRGELVKVRDVNLYLSKDEMKDEKIVKDQLLAEVAYLGQQQSCSFYKHDQHLKIGDIISKGLKPVHTIQIAISEKGEAEFKYHEGGGINKMGKEGEESVTFTEEQAKAMVASAVAEVTEKLDNAHAVETTDLEKANTTKIDELETEHAKIVKEAEDATTKLKEQIETELRGEVKTKLGMSDEVSKTLDVFNAEQLSAMKGWTMPVVATAGAGISSASGGEAKIRKIEEVGNYNAITRKYEPTYREEAIE